MDAPIHIVPNPWPDMRRQPLFAALVTAVQRGANDIMVDVSVTYAFE